MKLLLLFLFTVSANAAFIPIPSAPINYYAVGVLGKGELLTSNGTSNGTQAACADDELLVWDATEVSGVKCAPAPSGGSAYSCQQKYLLSNISASFGTVLVDMTMVIGNVYIVEFLSEASGSPIVNLYMGSNIKTRGQANVSATSAPFEATSTSLQLRSGASATFFFRPRGGETGQLGTWMKLCEVSGATAPNVDLN